MEVEEREFENYGIGPKSGKTKSVVLPFNDIPWWAKEWGKLASKEDELTFTIGGYKGVYRRIR